MMAKETAQRPALFETARIAKRRDRADRCGFAGRGDFLHVEVAGLLGERLAEVTRDFNDAVIIGCGGGVHTEALQGRVGQVHQLEWSPARAAQAGIEPTDFSDTLPLEPESCDLIVSALELHWANDPVGQLIQMRRALRPDGLMIAAMFGGQTLAELRDVLSRAEVEVTGGLSPHIAPMGEIRDLGGLIQRAGLTMPVADSERLPVTYSDALALMRDLRAMGETNILADRRRVGLTKRFLQRVSELYAADYPAPDNRIRATFEIVFLTGWAPAPDQPKPLRPGSAKKRLADALAVPEHKLNDKARPGET
ncbi:MAG: methyltransferase domain-containing protein [Pseudomonadota bacterium]